MLKNILNTSNIQFQYDQKNQFIFPDIHCNTNDELLILGRSGIGKTTLLHILCGLIKPTKGSVLINDTNIVDLSEKSRDQFRKKNIGIILQKPVFIESLNVIENLRFFSTAALGNYDETVLHNFLLSLNLNHKAHQKVTSLSQGEQQRLSIIRALLAQPSILFADEPSSSLDDDNAYAMVGLIRQVASDSKAALVIVTHDARLKNLFPNQIVLS